MDEPADDVITPERVERIAELARLRLTDTELQGYTAHLRKVLDHAADLDEVDLEGLPFTWQAVPMVNVLRPDVPVEAAVDRTAVLDNAPDAAEGRFRVPPILGEAP